MSLLQDDRIRIKYKDGTEVEMPNEGLKALKKVAPEVVERMGYEEGGVAIMIAPKKEMKKDSMPEEQEEDMLPDDEMEDEYLDFILDEALDNEEEDFLMDALQGMIESRGKYGLTNVTYTCKIGSFLPFGMVHTNILNSCVAAAGDAGTAGQ